MRSATKTLAIITAVLSGIVGIILFVMSIGFLANIDATIAQLINDGMPSDVANEQAHLTITLLFIFGSIALIDAIYNGVIAGLVHNDKFGKIARIVMGAFDIGLGAVIPGVLLIVEACISKKKEPENEDKPAKAE